MSRLTDNGISATFFHELCDAAAAQTLPLFRSDPGVTNKWETGFDPVTEADRQAERAIRDIIGRQFPDHGIVGEEFPAKNPDAELQWIIDPIDGTRAFICGLPVWGTLIALYENGIPVAGVVDQPFTGERYMASPKENSGITESYLIHRDGEPLTLKTSGETSLDAVTMMTTSPHLLDNDQDRAYFRLEEEVNMVRYGCDCYAYCMVAGGHIGLVVESGLNIYDVAALIPIVEGAGGVLTNWQGGDASRGGQVIAAANQHLLEHALEILA